MAPYKDKQYTVKITVDGRPYWVRGKTEKEAREKAALKRQALEAGERVITGSMTVDQWAEVWHKTYKQPKVNKRNYADMVGRYDKHISPIIGRKRVRNVKPADVQAVLNEMQDRYSESLIKKTRDQLRGIFKEAYRHNLVKYDPTEGLTLPRAKGKQQRRAITERERELTLRVAETSRGGLFVLIMLYCGLRPGEVAALRWTDVDMQKRILHVDKAVKSDNSMGGPKSRAGVRDVPIPTYLYDRLANIKHGPFDLVVTNSQGHRYTESSIQRMWKTFKREMQIAAGCRVFRNQLQPPFPIADDLTLYCYRHTYGTDLQAAGVPINVAKELMGHENISVTAQIYTHKSDAAFSEAAAKIERYHA